MKTMICLIIDRSGSMAGREDDVVGGVNTFIVEQKALPDPASIAFVRFDSEAIERRLTEGNWVPVNDAGAAMTELTKCPPLTPSEYVPRAGTPLLDAAGSTILALDEDWRREQPDRCIVVIVTDGHENASREFTKSKVKELVEAREKSGKWAFLYLGANVDSFKEAGALGIRGDNSADWLASARGTRSAYQTLSHSVRDMRTTGNTTASNLGGRIEEDGTVTKRRNTRRGGTSTKKTTPSNDPQTLPEPPLVWTPPSA